MERLDAINQMLRMSSHQTVNAVTAGDQRSNIALATLERVRKEVLTSFWGFNELKLDLPVDANGRVPLPQVYLTIQIEKPHLVERLDVADNLLYVYDIQKDAWHDTIIQNVRVTYDIDAFEMIPDPFALWIAWQATEQFYAEHRGEPTRYIQKQHEFYRARAVNLKSSKTINDATGFNRVKAGYIQP